MLIYCAREAVSIVPAFHCKNVQNRWLTNQMMLQLKRSDLWKNRIEDTNGDWTLAVFVVIKTCNGKYLSLFFRMIFSLPDSPKSHWGLHNSPCLCKFPSCIPQEDQGSQELTKKQEVPPSTLKGNEAWVVAHNFRFQHPEDQNRIPPGSETTTPWFMRLVVQEIILWLDILWKHVSEATWMCIRLSIWVAVQN